MSHLVLVQCAEPMTSGSLAGLVRQQMTGRIEAMSGALPGGTGTSSRSREWEALARGLWRMAADTATDQAKPDRLPWGHASAPAALPRALVPA